jgi:hypothetical protein
MHSGLAAVVQTKGNNESSFARHTTKPASRLLAVTSRIQYSLMHVALCLCHELSRFELLAKLLTARRQSKPVFRSGVLLDRYDGCTQGKVPVEACNLAQGPVATVQAAAMSAKQRKRLFSGCFMNE